MIFRNENKYLMYKILIKFSKCNSMQQTQKYIINKFKIDEWYFAYLTGQCVEHHLIDGIVISKSINNHYHTIYTENIYITYNGYDFLKNYYSFIKNVLWNLFLIITTATITAIINNEFSTSNQGVNIRNEIMSQCSSCFEICDYSDN